MHSVQAECGQNSSNTYPHYFILNHLRTVWSVFDCCYCVIVGHFYLCIWCFLSLISVFVLAVQIFSSDIYLVGSLLSLLW